MTIDNFDAFRDDVAKQVTKMTKVTESFYVDIDKDVLWETYLAAFPEGTNPIHKERTEHDCNCCKNFIRNVGGLVTITNGVITSVWDIKTSGFYQEVADALALKVRQYPVKNVFRSDTQNIGAMVTHQHGDDGAIVWDHFYAKLPNKLVMHKDDIASYKGGVQANFDVLKRSVEEISDEAIDIVLDLISQKSIYRGEEHKPLVQKLKKVKRDYDKVGDDKTAFLWQTAVLLGYNARFKNTVIGTLLEDISSGVELERAVKSFEDKVAPQNYKRSSALITKGMIEKAQKKVEELGIEDALHRRFAVADDLTINNVLFADRNTKKKMKGVFDELTATAAQKKPSLDKVQEIGVEEFVNDVLPKVETMEVFVENKHTPNFVSLIAPMNEDAAPILKWNNNFTWSYNGEMTDSIKERVKAAGGNVAGDLRASLSWFNYDDLDLHVVEPDGNEIFFGNKRSLSTGGHLDVDMNVSRETRTPVENLIWPSMSKMKEGDYKIFVHNYTKRETTDVGFEVEIEYNGNIETFTYDKAVRAGANVQVAVVNFSKRDGFTMKPKLTSSKVSKDVWGVNTEGFHKVEMVMHSPNHWDGEEIGNKHWFFMLEDCKNPDQARGFYNEFLRGDLTEHRKVFEVLSSKMKTAESDNQLSGLGFSSTKENSLLCRVTGSFNRTLKIKF